MAMLFHWLESFDRLAEIAMYKDNWDNAGAPAMSVGVVNGAFHLVNLLCRADAPLPDAITPSLDGTILFEWHCKSGWWEIEIESPGVWILRSVTYDRL